MALDGKTKAKTTLSEPWFIPGDQHRVGKPRECLPGDPAALWYHISKFQALGSIHIQDLEYFTDTHNFWIYMTFWVGPGVQQYSMGTQPQIFNISEKHEFKMKNNEDNRNTPPPISWSDFLAYLWSLKTQTNKPPTIKDKLSWSFLQIDIGPYAISRIIFLSEK